MAARPEPGRLAGRDDAMALAFRLLARRSRSRAEIAAALERRGFPAALVRRVLGRLHDLGYIDDRKYAAERAERLSERGFGSRRLRLDLTRSGLPESVVDEVMPDAREEARRARELLERRFPGRGPGERARAYRFLARRGFPDEVIADLIGPFE